MLPFTLILFYFQMIIAGYILSIYNHMQEEQQRLTPGNTPIRRHDNSSQTQVDKCSSASEMTIF